MPFLHAKIYFLSTSRSYVYDNPMSGHYLYGSQACFSVITQFVSQKLLISNDVCNWRWQFV